MQRKTGLRLRQRFQQSACAAPDIEDDRICRHHYSPNRLAYACIGAYPVNADTHYI